MESSASMAPEFSAVLLAGGRSSRMGRDKALLRHPVSGLPLLVHQANTLRTAGCAELLLSVRAGHDYDLLGPEVPRLTDDGTGGPLPVIDQALGVIRCPVLFLIAVDMPFVTPDLLHALVARSTPERGVVVRLPRGLEPLCAVYAKKSRPAFHDSRARLAYALQPLLAAGIRDGWILAVDDADPGLFVNWNYPEDLCHDPMPTPS